MKTLKIYSDMLLGGPELKLLREGLAPHELTVAAKPTSSVLAKAEHDPAFGDADIALGQPDVATVLGSEKLQWVHLTSAGYTRYDTSAFREGAAARKLRLTNSSSVYAAPCAEHVFSFMMAQARRLPRALGSRCANGTPEWNRLRRESGSLRGQSVLILGYGAIAARLVEMLRPFDMQITALRRKAKGDEGVAVITQEGLPEALGLADHVVNILPENAESVGFVSAARLARMKPGAAFYNIGRGTTVNQDDLLGALQSGQIGAAWLDVTDPEPLPEGHPLLGASNCYITPHVAGGHANETESLVRHFLVNFQHFVQGTPLQDRII